MAIVKFEINQGNKLNTVKIALLCQVTLDDF